LESRSDTQDSEGEIWVSRLRRRVLRLAIPMSDSVIGDGGELNLIMVSRGADERVLYVRCGLSRERYVRSRAMSAWEKWGGRDARRVARVWIDEVGVVEILDRCSRREADAAFFVSSSISECIKSRSGR
jgi:hypothetical protein